jgi:AbrB family looped-hinge helix DNA binding protein
MPTATATVTSKGQITIPADIRKRAAIKEGTRVSFTPKDDKTFVMAVETDPLDKLKGMLSYDGPAVSLAQIRDAIDRELAGKWNPDDRH